MRPLVQDGIGEEIGINFAQQSAQLGMTAGEMRQALEVFGDLPIDQEAGGHLTA